MRSRTAPAGATVRSWRGEPRHVVGALVAILAASAVLPLWNLGRSGDFDFYAAAVRSMSTSWRAFAFGSFDPGAAVTLDKLSGFLVPQALSARLFGFSWSALALPQVLEGVVTVYCCATVALRLAGTRTGLFAAAAAASTPIFVSMFGRPMEDGALTAALAAALLWWQRAVVTRAVWPLLVSGVFVGLGFQAKMLQAWLILPALVLALLFAVPRPLAAIGRGAAVIGSAVVVSLSWMTAMQLVPAADRPWFDGSVRNSVFSTVFLYNGLDRLLPVRIPPRSPDPLSTDTGRLLHTVALSNPSAAQVSPLKLLLPYYTTQVGWLFPLAIAGIVLGVLRLRRTRGPERAVFAAVVIWLAVAAAVLSKAALAHTAYVAAIGVQLAVLAALAFAEAVRLARDADGPARFVLPALAVVQGAWALVLAGSSWLPAELLGLLVALVLAGVAAALLVRRADRPARVRAAAFVAGVGLLAGAVTWSLQSVDPLRAGTGGDAYVGPKSALAGSVAAPAAWRPRRPDPLGGHPRLPPTLDQVVAATRGAPGILFAADSERVSSLVIQATGREVLTDGGYSGGVPVLTTARLGALVNSGRLHWFVVFTRPPRLDAVDRYVASGPCRVVRTWPSRRGSRVFGHGLELRRCEAGMPRPTPAAYAPHHHRRHHGRGGDSA